MAVLMICALLSACTLLYEAQTGDSDGESADASPTGDGQVAGEPDGQVPNSDGSLPSGGMLGNCILGTGAEGSLALTVTSGWIPVSVCGPSGTTCGSGVEPPCICAPGTQCSIPFRVGSEIHLETDMCSRWTAPALARTAEIFNITVEDSAPLLVVVEPRFCE